MTAKCIGNSIAHNGSNIHTTAVSIFMSRNIAHSERHMYATFTYNDGDI